MCRHYVAYYRVSTAKQGKSGLGLEAQEAAALAFVAGRGLDAKLLASFTEVESGKKSDKDRPELARAMEHARLTGATLLIAKLDRLSRDAHFLLGLQKAGVQFIAADMPEANEMVVGLMAVIAQAERKMISQRTKAALAEARKRVAIRGQKRHPDIKRLGNPRGAAHLRKFGNKLATEALSAKAQERATGLAATLEALRVEGIASANAIARALNARNYATPRGGKWTARSVLNVAHKLGLTWLTGKPKAA
jgi:DNA invertase Pin-like site-specific DNA recombinase